MLIQERIQMILKMHNLTSAAFADKIGVQRSSVSHVISGRNKPGLDFLEKILVHFPRVNAHWLITGSTSNENESTVLHSADKKNEKTIGSLVAKDFANKKTQKIVLFYEDGTFQQYINAE
ncbi:MAG: helix-turn-helix transcriptional regulator [Bacteroidota bacterium]